MKDLKYRVDKITPEDDLRKTLPKLISIPEFEQFYNTRAASRQWRNSIIKYIGLIYDHKSELLSEYPRNLEKRKDAAAEMAGFVRDETGNWKDSYQEFIQVKPNRVPLILAFLKDQNNYLWTEIVTTEQELEEFQTIRWKKITTTKTRKRRGKGKEGEDNFLTIDIEDKDLFDATSKKDKLMDACEKRLTRLEELYKRFYRDNADVHKAVQDMPITPENALELLANVS